MRGCRIPFGWSKYYSKEEHFQRKQSSRRYKEISPGEGFDFSFTWKGSHEGTGWNVALYMVVILYGRNVIAAEQYHGRVNPKTFSSFVCEHFARGFKKVLKVWLSFIGQCRTQICMGWAWLLKIYGPARTPDLNPVENIFHIVKRRLHQDALDWQIT